MTTIDLPIKVVKFQAEGFEDFSSLGSFLMPVE